jgi:hypothetical protein
MQNRIFHLSFCIVLLLSVDCFAGGTYQVGQDQGGIYFQTDNDGGWYIGKSDLKDFKIGQTGTYSIEKDRNGTFLLTDKNRKFYLDVKAKEKQDIENDKVNQEYERKMAIMRKREAERKAEWARETQKEAEDILEQKIGRSYTPKIPNIPQYRSRGAVNPRTGEYYPSTGGGGAVDPRDGTYFAPAGPSGVVNTRTGEFMPTVP